MMHVALRRVYSRPFYVVLTVITAALTLSVLLLLPNQSLLFSILLSPAVSVASKVVFFVSLHGTLFSNFTWFTGTYTVLIAALFGINASLLWFYVSRTRQVTKTDSTLTFTGIGGFVSGLFGIGCAACGTIIVSGFLKLFGIAWLLTYLPLHGAEFGVLGVILLSLTTYSLAKRINDPLVCPVK